MRIILVIWILKLQDIGWNKRSPNGYQGRWNRSEIMSKALDQARDARLHILSEMGKVISEARKDPSPYAPRYTHVKTDPSKIAAVIGKGGATIKSIIEKTGAQIDIDDSGLVKIASNDQSIGDKAKEMIEEITVGPQVDKIYEGRC